MSMTKVKVKKLLILSNIIKLNFRKQRRTLDSGNGIHSVSLPLILNKSNASTCIYNFDISLYFTILYLISYFKVCTALFLG